jgi:hypothetical protein
MGEIKSTIDLVMERTKGLKFDEEDRHRLEVEKADRTAHALVVRYLQGDLTLAEISRERDSTAPFLREATLRFLVGEGLHLGREEFSRGFEALETWKGKESRGVIVRLQDLSLQFGHALQKRKRKVKADLWDELAKMGVQGSAVEPNVEGSAKWHEVVEKLARDFEPKLKEIKDALLAEVQIR